MMSIKEMRKLLNETQPEFSEHYGIPYRTIQNWETGSRIPPDYVLALLERCVLEDYAQAKAEGELIHG